MKSDQKIAARSVANQLSPESDRLSDSACLSDLPDDTSQAMYAIQAAVNRASPTRINGSSVRMLQILTPQGGVTRQ